MKVLILVPSQDLLSNCCTHAQHSMLPSPERDEKQIPDFAGLHHFWIATEPYSNDN